MHVLGRRLRASRASVGVVGERSERRRGVGRAKRAVGGGRRQALHSRRRRRFASLLIKGYSICIQIEPYRKIKLTMKQKQNHYDEGHS